MNILAGVIGAALGLLGVVVGAWINNHRQDRRWVRDKKLEGAAEFITAAGQLYSDRRGPDPATTEETRQGWRDRMQNGRSIIHLLCGPETIERAEDLAGRVWRGDPTGPHREETIEALRAFTAQIRAEITGSAGLVRGRVR